CQQFNRAPPTF
nr:immunoglobulin light chain junction region [Macaca mulatta]